MRVVDKKRFGKRSSENWENYKVPDSKGRGFDSRSFPYLSIGGSPVRFFGVFGRRGRGGTGTNILRGVGGRGSHLDKLKNKTKNAQNPSSHFIYFEAKELNVKKLKCTDLRMRIPRDGGTPENRGFSRRVGRSSRSLCYDFKAAEYEEEGSQGRRRITSKATTRGERWCQAESHFFFFSLYFPESRAGPTFFLSLCFAQRSEFDFSAQLPEPSVLARGGFESKLENSNRENIKLLHWSLKLRQIKAHNIILRNIQKFSFLWLVLVFFAKLKHKSSIYI